MPTHLVSERRQDPEDVQRDWWHFRSVLEQRRQQDCSLILEQHCLCHGFQDVVQQVGLPIRESVAHSRM
uniref:Uncharacterized protein n=1 Tax=Arundo donax TaxID=35708 RepID=A0A0A9GCV7_ARUDO